MEKYNYFPAKLVHSEHLLEFTNLKDFNRFLITQKLTTVFILNDSGDETQHFAVSYKGGLLRQSTEGFKSLEDYNDAVREQFPDSASFYTAQSMGYKTYADYKLVSEAGISDAGEYKAMKEKGFASGFTELKNDANGADVEYANAYEFYKDAIAKGFENYAEYKKANKNGFTDGHLYKVAIAKGFENAVDYKLAIQLGFDSARDFEFARKRQIRDRADLMRFQDLDLFKNSGFKSDQCLLLALLSRLPDGKRISINKMEELFTKEKAEYNYPDTKALPPWFTTALNGRQSMVDFLLNNNVVKKYGNYDNDGEFFETKTIQNRKVVIDGSNVAHNSHGNERSKPLANNVIRLVSELKSRGFNDISIIVDASLRHRIEDKEKLNELRKAAEYVEAPAETSADIFIIQYVKHEHCMLVSNDLFREWKKLDPWVAHNIDFYRLTFLITDDRVVLPDLDKTR